jgi:hypothetical protein
MMHIDIIVDSILLETPKGRWLYRIYSEYLFKKIQRQLRKEVRKHIKRYEVRIPYLLTTSLIHWKKYPPKTINLFYYLDNCLELVNRKGTYVIKLNDYKLVRGSFTKVSTLIRILEYGTDKIPELPVIRHLFSYYSKNYNSLFNEFVKESFLYEFLSVRQSDNRQTKRRDR